MQRSASQSARRVSTQRNAFWWRAARLIGSLEAAVCLLPTLAVALFLGALVESWYEQAVAQQLVFGTWWFALLLTLLGANIFFAAVKKWPWKPHQTGFLITHVGLLTLVGGGLFSALTGLTGVMALVDSPASEAARFGPHASNEAIDRQQLVLRVARVDRGADDFFEAPFVPGVSAWQPTEEALEPDLLTRALLWLAHPVPRSFRHELDATTTFEVLDYQPHTQFDPSQSKDRAFTPVPRMLGQVDARTTPAALVRLTHAGEARELWIGREDGGYLPVTVGRERFGLSLASRAYELPFTLQLQRVEQRTDRGSRLPATQTSEVLLSDEESGFHDRPHTITLNEPLAYRGYRVYQAGYEMLGRDPTGRPLQRSLLRVTLDPGLRFKYVGSLLVASGIACMFYMRAYRLPFSLRST